MMKKCFFHAPGKYAVGFFRFGLLLTVLFALVLLQVRLMDPGEVFRTNGYYRESLSYIFAGISITVIGGIVIEAIDCDRK